MTRYNSNRCDVWDTFDDLIEYRLRPALYLTGNVLTAEIDFLELHTYNTRFASLGIQNQTDRISMERSGTKKCKNIFIRDESPRCRRGDMVDIHLNNYHGAHRDHYGTGKTEKLKIKNKYKTRNKSVVVLSCVARDGQTKSWKKQK